MTKGIIYILTNAAMPGYIKIGMTTKSLKERMSSLDSTSTPLPFECFYAMKVDNVESVEKNLHGAFGDHRVRKNREFFKVNPERVRYALALANGEEITFNAEPDEETIKFRRPAFNFKMVDISPGTTLTFTRDENITCEVADNKYVMVDNEKMSLTAAVSIAFQKMGRNSSGPFAGPDYWIYEDETLSERRIRMETDE